MQQITIALEPTTAAQLEAVSKRTGRDPATIVNDILSRWLDDLEDLYDNIDEREGAELCRSEVPHGELLEELGL